jgi:hypothetical protein
MVGSTTTIPSPVFNMSGGMEDAHERERQERFHDEQRNSDDASVESHPKAQETLIDFQNMADSTETEDEEEEVAATQVSPTTATAPSTNNTASTITVNDAAISAPPTAAHTNPLPTSNPPSSLQQATNLPPAPTNPSAQPFDFNVLIQHINSAINTTVATSMATYTANLEKKERANEIQRAAQQAEITTLLDELKEAKKKQATLAPPPTDICIDSATTPTSKATFASAASTSVSTNQQSHKSPAIPQLLGTPPRPKPLNSPHNPYAKPSPNFKATGNSEDPTVIRTTPSSVKYRELAPIEYEDLVAKHHRLIPTRTFHVEAAPSEHNILWLKATATASKLSKYRKDDDDSDFGFAAVGHHFCDCIALFEKYH